MAEAKTKKMSQSFDPETGTLTFAFPGLEPLSYRLSDFPQNVVAFWTGFGMKTAGRNASIGSDEDGSVGTPETMRKRVEAKFAAWKQGILRATTGGEERAPASTLLLEAAVIYKRMKAAMTAGDDVDNWANYDGPDAESLRPEVEKLDDVVTNPEAVAKAKSDAEAKGEDGEAAASKATVTQLDVLKASNLFKLAMQAAKAQREAAKKAALKAALAKEAAGA